MKTELWNEYEIRDLAEAMGYLIGMPIEIVEREFLYDGRFILSKDMKVYYECDFYGDSEYVLIPNVIIELEKYLDCMDSESRNKYIQIINSALYTSC